MSGNKQKNVNSILEEFVADLKKIESHGQTNPSTIDVYSNRVLVAYQKGAAVLFEIAQSNPLMWPTKFYQYQSNPPAEFNILQSGTMLFEVVDDRTYEVAQAFLKAIEQYCHEDTITPLVIHSTIERALSGRQPLLKDRVKNYEAYLNGLVVLNKRKEEIQTLCFEYNQSMGKLFDDIKSTTRSLEISSASEQSLRDVLSTLADLEEKSAAIGEEFLGSLNTCYDSDKDIFYDIAWFENEPYLKHGGVLKAMVDSGIELHTSHLVQVSPSLNSKKQVIELQLDEILLSEYRKSVDAEVEKQLKDFEEKQLSSAMLIEKVSIPEQIATLNHSLEALTTEVERLKSYRPDLSHIAIPKFFNSDNVAECDETREVSEQKLAIQLNSRVDALNLQIIKVKEQISQLNLEIAKESTQGRARVIQEKTKQISILFKQLNEAKVLLSKRQTHQAKLLPDYQLANERYNQSILSDYESALKDLELNSEQLAAEKKNIIERQKFLYLAKKHLGRYVTILTQSEGETVSISSISQAKLLSYLEADDLTKDLINDKYKAAEWFGFNQTNIKSQLVDMLRGASTSSHDLIHLKTIIQTKLGLIEKELESNKNQLSQIDIEFTKHEEDSKALKQLISKTKHSKTNKIEEKARYHKKLNDEIEEFDKDSKQLEVEIELLGLIHRQALIKLTTFEIECFVKDFEAEKLSALELKERMNYKSRVQESSFNEKLVSLNHRINVQQKELDKLTGSGVEITALREELQVIQSNLIEINKKLVEMKASNHISSASSDKSSPDVLKKSEGDEQVGQVVQVGQVGQVVQVDQIGQVKAILNSYLSKDGQFDQYFQERAKIYWVQDIVEQVACFVFRCFSYTTKLQERKQYISELENSYKTIGTMSDLESLETLNRILDDGIRRFKPRVEQGHAGYEHTLQSKLLELKKELKSFNSPRNENLDPSAFGSGLFI